MTLEEAIKINPNFKFKLLTDYTRKKLAEKGLSLKEVTKEEFIKSMKNNNDFKLKLNGNN